MCRLCRLHGGEDLFGRNRFVELKNKEVTREGAAGLCSSVSACRDDLRIDRAPQRRDANRWLVTPALVSLVCSAG